MSNIFQIKRGGGEPPYLQTTDTEPKDNKSYYTKSGDIYTLFVGSDFVQGTTYYESALKKFELGFNTTNKTLYINNNGEIIIPFAEVAFSSQTANYVLAAPNGSNGTPTFRALVAADIPNLAASKITSGTLAITQGGTGAATAAINTVFAGPGSGSTAAPSFRALVAADIPNLNASKITAGTFDVARIPNLSADKITDGTINGNIYIGEATDNVNRYVYLRSSLGGIGFYSNGSSNNTKGIWLQAHGTDTSGKAMIYADTNNNITYAAGIMNGTLTMKASQYTDDYTGALNMNNSNIYGVNAIYTSDDAGSATEGFNFYRTATTVDTIHAHSGVFYFTPNRTLGTSGTSYKVYHAGNLTCGTADPSGGANGDIYIKYTT